MKVISEGSGPWRSPILLIRKVGEDGVVTYRFCIDLRKVNELTVKDSYSLPRISLSGRFGGKKAIGRKRDL